MYVYSTLNNKSVIIGLTFSPIELTETDTQKFINHVSDNLNMAEVGNIISMVNTQQYSNGTYVSYIPPKKILSKFEFNSKFTLEELVAITDAAKTDTTVAVLFNKFNIADEINLDDPTVSYGLSLLVGKSLLTQERMNTILGI